MKIKRFFASDIRQAIKLVREELGPEAIILSNRQVDGGIEIVSAIDYDESIFNKNSPRTPTEQYQDNTSTRSNVSENRASSGRAPLNSEPERRASSSRAPLNSEPERQASSSRAPLNSEPERRASSSRASLNSESKSRASLNRAPLNSEPERRASSSRASLNSESKSRASLNRAPLNPEPESRASSNRAPFKPEPEKQEFSNWAPSNEFSENEQRNHVTPRKTAANRVHEPSMGDVSSELKSLRALLENQLSGFAWNEMQRRSPMHAELLKRMTRMGLSASLCQDLANSISPSDDLSHLWYQAQGLLASKIPSTNDDILNDGGVIALVGSTGVGKTTTIAKLAARYALRHGSRNVALITLDNYRIGAVEQLRAYGRILDIPVRVAAKGDDLSQLVEDFYDRRLVLIDTAGMSQRDSQLELQLEVLRRDRSWLKSYLVLPTTTRLSSMEEVVRVYKQADLAGCILTKLDETTSLGSALSTIIHHQLPVAYVCDGQRVPEDMDTARSDSLVRQAVAIMEENEALLEGESLAYNVGGAVS